MRNVALELVEGLAGDETAALLALAGSKTLDPGEPLFRLGAAADTLYVVARGRIALSLPMRIRGGEEDVLVEEKEPGETVGWSGLVAPHRFTLNATAAVPSEVLAFSRSVLLDHFRAHPAVGYAVTRNVATVIGHRLLVFQTMWLREMQRTLEYRYA